jgi:hypothetical protein
MRCAALGYRVEVVDSTTRGEMPHQVGAWTRQRTRWQKGWMLTALVHTRNPVETRRAFGGAGTIALLMVLAGTPLLHLAQSLAFVLWVSGCTALVAGDLRVKTILAIAQLAALVVWTVLALVAARRRGVAQWVLSPLAVAYWAMQWAAAWRAVRQLVSSPFTWEKTPHRAMPRPAGDAGTSSRSDRRGDLEGPGDGHRERPERGTGAALRASPGLAMDVLPPGRLARVDRRTGCQWQGHRPHRPLGGVLRAGAGGGVLGPPQPRPVSGPSALGAPCSAGCVPARRGLGVALGFS